MPRPSRSPPRRPPPTPPPQAEDAQASGAAGNDSEPQGGSRDGGGGEAAAAARRQSSKEDVLSALGGRGRAGDPSVPLPLPSPRQMQTRRGGVSASSPPLEWTTASAPVRSAAAPAPEPEPEPEPRQPASGARPPAMGTVAADPGAGCDAKVLDDGVEPWLREAQLLEQAIEAQREAGRSAPPTVGRRLSDGRSDGGGAGDGEVVVTFSEQGALGLNLTDSEHGDGTMVLGVQPGSQAAANAALEPGLVVTSVGNTLVMGRPHEAVSRAIVAHPERPLTLLFSRVQSVVSAAPPLPPPPIALDDDAEQPQPPAAATAVQRRRSATPPRVRPGSPGVARSTHMERSARQLVESYSLEDLESAAADGQGNDAEEQGGQQPGKEEEEEEEEEEESCSGGVDALGEARLEARTTEGGDTRWMASPR